MEDGLAARTRLIGSRALHRRDIEVDDGVTWRSNEDLAAFFRYSNWEVRSVRPSRPLRARFAVFPHTTIVHVSSPPAEAYWPRDETSHDRDRVLVVVTTAGALDIETDGVLLQRPGLTVICPGDTPLVARLTADDNEVVYASMSARLLPDVTLPSASHRIDKPVDRSIVAPSVMFMAGLCGISTASTEGAAPLRTAAELVTRSLLLQAIGGVGEPPSLFVRAMELIVLDHADPRLSVRMIAQRLGVSERTLQGAFSSEGTTARSQLRDVRVRAAIRLHTENDGLPYSAISRAVGFGSESALYRALREHDAAEPRAAE